MVVNIVKKTKSIDDVIIENRMSELIFKRGMLLDVFHSFDPYYIKNWMGIRKKTDKYKCKKCNSIINEGERLKHYAQYHYEKEVTK